MQNWFDMPGALEGFDRNPEYLEKMTIDYADADGKNNYLYMVRRKESLLCDRKTTIDALRFIQSSLIKWDSFAVVNVALTFALCFCEDKDWQIADELMKNISANQLDGVVSWWADVAGSGDAEGYLVHFFLLKHNKINKSELGSKKQLAEKISNSISNIPEWLCEYKGG